MLSLTKIALKNKKMNKLLKKIRYHIAYWIFVLFALLFVFRSAWVNLKLLFLYIGLFMPIVLATSYFFNYVIVPNYYLTRRYARFIFYTFCTAVVSWYIEILALVFAYVTLAKFSYITPNSIQAARVAIVLYMLVFVGSFLFIMNQIIENRKVINGLVEEREKMKKAVLEIMSNRKMVKIAYDEIIYIESLSDYIKIITNSEEFVSKEKISRLAERLPDMFIRIHRSFIINSEKIKERSADHVIVNDYKLNIGRSYRNEVKVLLNS